MARLSRIIIYPIKSLDGVEVREARLTRRGGLEGDREFAIFDADGRTVNGKKEARVHVLRARFDLKAGTVDLRSPRETGRWHLQNQRGELQSWLSGFFGREVSLLQDRSGGFPDDVKYPGPTLVSAASLKAAASWFKPMPLGEARARFRANLEVTGVPAFWEDLLVRSDGRPVPFQAGAARLEGHWACQRCVVPTRQPQSGESHPGFAREFARRREAALPAWADRAAFTHFYRFTVNTRVPPSEAGKTLRVGDAVKILP